MGAKSSPPSADVLVNQARAISLYTTVQRDGVWEATEQITTVQFRLTNLALARIEDHYGSLQAWEKVMNDKPVSAVIRALAIGLNREFEDVGVAMVEGAFDRYITAIGAAYLTAIGADEETSGKFIREVAGARRNASRGTSGGPRGSEAASDMPSSGG